MTTTGTADNSVDDAGYHVYQAPSADEDGLERLGLCEIPDGPTFCHLEMTEAELIFNEVRLLGVFFSRGLICKL